MTVFTVHTRLLHLVWLYTLDIFFFFEFNICSLQGWFALIDRSLLMSSEY